jgi:hypothetical protein
MDWAEIFEQFDFVAAEYSSDAVAGLVPLDPATVAAVTEGDPEPKFATFVIESGWSKSKRFWGPELFQNVAEQINSSDESIVGYMGHIRPEDDPYVFPEIQLHWLRAKAISAGDKAKLAVKAYVLPGTKGRDYLKRGLVKSVSWRGKVLQVPFEKGVRVKEYVIESIDLSRPRAAGMSAKLVGGLTSEMEEGSDEVKPEEISALAANELRAHNAKLVSEIEADARKPLEVKVSEMETENESLKADGDILAKVRAALEISPDADVLDVLGKVLDQVKAAGRTVRESILATVLEKKFKDRGTQKLVAAALASEMSGLTLFCDEAHRDDDQKAVSEMVNNYINQDDDLKKLVSEMEETPPAVTNTSPPRDNDPEYKPGMENSRIRVRSAA